MFGQYSARSNGGTYHGPRRAASNATGERVKAVFATSQTAHVWAQMTQDFGKSANGNLYFEGRALFSYGSHYVAGFVLPVPGEDFDSASRGVVLINADKNSVTTGGHVSDARNAARGAFFHVPGLTNICAIIERADRAACRAGSEPFAVIAARELAAVFTSQDDSTPEPRALVALFAAIGVKNPEKFAAKVAAQAAKKQAERAAKVAADKTARLLSDAKRYAATTPQEVAARIKRRAMESGSYSWDSERVESDAREVLRAAKVAKGKGWTRVAADARAVYKAMRAALPEFLAAEIRRNRLRAWRELSGKVRRALTPATADELAESSRYRGDGGPNRSGMAARASALHDGANAARALRSFLGAESIVDAWNRADSRGGALRSARMAGVDVAATVQRLADLASRFDSEAERADAGAARDTLRRHAAALRAFKNITADASDAERLKVADAALKVAESYAPRVYGAHVAEPYREVPRPFRVAGFTSDTFAAVLSAARSHAVELRAAIAETSRLAAMERNRIQREREEKERADALPLWRAGGRPPYTVRADDQGRAYIRAVGVERDDSGTITGGTLQTSQGADVPLTHALKVFRFLKLCRDKGEPWRANGRTVRVGHFTLDSVAANGDFVAGCHKIAWQEVADLAAALGVAELTPQDAREPSALTHA